MTITTTTTTTTIVTEAASIALPPSEDREENEQQQQHQEDENQETVLQTNEQEQQQQEEEPQQSADPTSRVNRPTETTTTKEDDDEDKAKIANQDNKLDTIKTSETISTQDSMIPPQQPPPSPDDDHHHLPPALLVEGEEEEVIPEDLPWWFPRRICCGARGRPVFYGNKVALGWVCTAIAQASIMVGMGAFMLTAIAKLAKIEAGCVVEVEEDEEELPECTGEVYGIKPSSLLTLMGAIVGLASAFLIPPMGAVVDFTNHRRSIGRCISVLYGLGILSMVFLNENNWFPLLIILTASLSVGWGQTTLMNAYLPEMTTDEERLNEFSKSFTVIIFCTMILCLMVTVGIATIFDFVTDDVALAKCSAIVATVMSAVLFYISWGLCFDEVQAMHELPSQQTLVGAGFRQVGKTSVKIWTQYNGLKWFYISICFGDAAVQSLTVIAITYATDLLQFNSQEVAIAGFFLLLGSIPGAIVGAWMNKLFNPIRSSAFAVFGMIVGTAIASLTLKGPGLQLLTYIFAFLWGLGTGWKYTGDRVLAAGIVPAGQDAELMGFYMFCGQIFSWVPSLTYTLLNEAGVSPRIGLSTLCVVFLGAFLSYWMMGDYSEAVAIADRLRVDSIPSVQQQQLKAKKAVVDSEAPVEATTTPGACQSSSGSPN